MPRKDPTTGVMVMTTGEFFEMEAKREGKGRSGIELMSDFIDQFEADRLEEERKLKDPKTALVKINDAINEYNLYDEEIRLPVAEEVLEVVSAECCDTVRQTGFKITAKCKRSGGVVDTVTIETCYTYGTRMDPPEGETLVSWELLPEA